MKALTFGSAMIDTIAVIDSERIEMMRMVNADRAFLLMEEGKKTEAHAISTHLGGGGVNTSVCLSRLGFEAAALVKTGDDQRADNIIAGLAKEGVETRWARRTPSLPTGASVIIASHDRNAAIFTYRGANTALEPEDIDEAAFEGAGLVHVCSLSDPSSARFAQIVTAAKKKGAQVSVNPGQRQLTARAGELLAAIGDVDILFLNRTETEALTPALVPQFGEGGPKFSGDKGEIPDLLKRGFRGGGFEMTFIRFVTAMMELGVDSVVITDGARGSFIAGEGEVVHCPIVKTKVASTVGAGDAFSSTFAAWRALGKSRAEAAIAAAHNAAGVVSFVDTQTGLMTRADLETAVAASKIRNDVRIWRL